MSDNKDYCPICGNIMTDHRCMNFDTPAYAAVSKPTGLKYDSGKLRYSLVPPIAMRALAEVLTFGALKYAPNNWQLVDNGKERYLDALYRHLEAYRSGELVDPESNLPHLSHAITNIAFLLHFESKEPHGII